MAPLPKLYRGENRIYRRLLRLADGVTPLPLANLAPGGIRVQIMQRGQAKASFVLGTDACLRQGATEDELAFEITTVTSALLTAGATVTLRWTIRLPDAAFLAEEGNLHIDITEEDVAFAA
ncbi:MAG: hypothetical protein NTV51_12215 [Verrucomicrobia bacterium]|nr:hypothetical protein [Verrucomicrobiota bacterium]